MMRKLLLSVVAAASLGAGLIATAGTANAYHHGFRHSGLGFGLYFGSPGYYGDPYFGRRYRFGNLYNRCGISRIRYHGRWHRARICNGNVVRIY